MATAPANRPPGFAVPTTPPPGFAVPATPPPGFAVPATPPPGFAVPATPPPGFAAPAQSPAIAALAVRAASAVPAASAAPAIPTAIASASKLHYHPPYEDMILRAIEALKDRKGSSRQAICKYITENYSNLPPTHATLLTHHLDCLLSKGVISMLNFSYTLADGFKKCSRPQKIIALPGTPAATNESKRCGQPYKLRPLTSAMKKKKRGMLPIYTVPADPASVYIILHAKQLKSDLLQNFPGAAAIILPKSLLSVKAAKYSIIIFPNVIQSLIDASRDKMKPAWPRNADMKEKPARSREVGKRKPSRPRKKSAVQKQVMVGEGQYNSADPVVKGPERPWKIRDMLVPGNVHAVLANGERMAFDKVCPEILKKSEELGMAESIHGSKNDANLNVKKKVHWAPKKKAIA